MFAFAGLLRLIYNINTACGYYIFKNTAILLRGRAVNRGLKGATLIGDTFKVPADIAYISARFLSTASIFVIFKFESPRATASCIEYQMARDEGDESMPKMQNPHPRLAPELAPRRKVEVRPRSADGGMRISGRSPPRGGPLAVDNRKEGLAKLRNVTGTRRDGYIDRENRATPSELRRRRMASPSRGRPPAIVRKVVKIKRNPSARIMPFSGR